MYIVIFSLENQRFGIPISFIKNVIRMVWITPIPEAPPYLMGIIHAGGIAMPVFNTRQLLGLPSCDIELFQQLILCEKDDRAIALWVDQVEQIKMLSPEQLKPAKEIDSHLKMISHVFKEEWGAPFILDIEQIFRLKESMHHGE